MVYIYYDDVEVVFARQPHLDLHQEEEGNSSEVPSTQPLHALSVDGKAPGSTDIKQVIIYNIAKALCRVDDLWNWGAVEQELHDLAVGVGEDDVGY